MGVFYSAAQATYENSNKAIELNTGIGFLLAHRPVMNHLPTEHILSLEAAYVTQLSGKGLFGKESKSWHQRYRSPVFRLGFVHTGTGNQEIIGAAFALTAGVELDLLRRNNFSVQFAPSVGPGWITKPYNLQNNYKNIAIGSNFNIFIGLAMRAKYMFKKVYLGGEVKFTHFSNGAWATPNLGINLPTVNIFAGYSISGNSEIIASPNTQEYKPYSNMILLGSIGGKENYPVNGKRYPIYNLQYQYRWFYSNRSALIGGLDMMHNVARIRQMELTHGTDNALKYTQLGANVGFAKTFDRFVFFLQNGIYLTNYRGTQGLIYNRIGGNMDINGWIWQFALKAHITKADHFEIGVGRRIGAPTHTKPSAL